MCTPAVADRRPPPTGAAPPTASSSPASRCSCCSTLPGALPWSFWLDAIALWPVLVMSAGLRMAVDRTRAPWLQLLVAGPRAGRAALARLLGASAGPAPRVTGTRLGRPCRRHRPRAARRPAPRHAVRGRGRAGRAGRARRGTDGEPPRHRAARRAASTARPPSSASKARGAGAPGSGRPARPTSGTCAWTTSLPLTVKLGGAMSRVDARSLRRSPRARRRSRASSSAPTCGSPGPSETPSSGSPASSTR